MAFFLVTVGSGGHNILMSL